MVNRLVSVGDDFTLPAAVKAADANLPTRLGAAALNTTIATATSGKLDKTEAATTYEAGHNTDLRKWYGALAGRYAAPARVLVIGDSNSEGTGSTSILRRWQSVLQAELRGRFQPPGVVGAAIPYISASPRINPLPSDYPATSTGSPVQASYGLGMKAATVAAGQSVTFTFTGDRFKLLGTKGSSVGRYNINIDGVVGTVGAGTVVDGFVSGSPVGGNLIYDSGTITNAAHTVIITRDTTTTASPGNVFPEGIVTFNGDHDKGVRVIDGARHGATLSVFTGSSAWTAAAFTRLGEVGLLVLPWGANDATGGTSAAAFGTALNLFISQSRTAGFTGSILLVEMPKRGAADPTVWNDYRTQIETIAAGDPDIAVLDLRRRMPDYGTTEATAQALYADEAHYTDKGQGWIADQIASAIIPR